MYEDGLGVEVNLIQAYLWSNRALNNDNENALQTRDHVAGLMSTEQLDEARRLAIER
jgi:TPR repeat protein